MHTHELDYTNYNRGRNVFVLVFQNLLKADIVFAQLASTINSHSTCELRSPYITAGGRKPQHIYSVSRTCRPRLAPCGPHCGQARVHLWKPKPLLPRYVRAPLASDSSSQLLKNGALSSKPLMRPGRCCAFIIGPNALSIVAGETNDSTSALHLRWDHRDGSPPPQRSQRGNHHVLRDHLRDARVDLKVHSLSRGYLHILLPAIPYGNTQVATTASNFA